jgi:hypothetical protein
VRCVWQWTAKVRRAVRRVAGVSWQRGQVGGASGCRHGGGGQAVGLAAAAGSGGKCGRLRTAGVRREVRWAADSGG